MYAAVSYLYCQQQNTGTLATIEVVLFNPFIPTA